MITLIKKISVMSVAFILFAAPCSSMNENDSNEDNPPHGITIENKVKLKSGKRKTIPIKVSEGFKEPLLVYVKNNEIVDVNTRLKIRLFSAKIIKKDNEFSLEITAEKGVNRTESDTILVKSLPKKPDFSMRRNNNTKFGAPLIITVTPR